MESTALLEPHARPVQAEGPAPAPGADFRRVRGDLGYSVRRWYIDQFFLAHAPALAGRVLDLGGTRRAKRGVFEIERYGVRVEYANVVPDKRPDFISDAASLACQDAVYDAVVCAELLEHVRNPEQVLGEISRVLKPGGLLLITVPFLCRIHGDPEDFGRYTDHYWLRALPAAELRVQHLERQGLFYSVLLDAMRQYAAHRRTLPGLIARPLARLLWALQGWAKRHEATQAVQANAFLQSFTTGFGIVAVKGSTG